jgi:alkanesulfonate monooxygenase SsuD/methylene tetrahydromethanopterin reductase-like flavin-dependent oxidoreductase (luciferase family)
MKIGITLPQMGSESSPAAIVEIAQEAERLDFASLWVGERLLRPRHYVPYGGGDSGIPEFQKIIATHIMRQNGGEAFTTSPP